MKLEHTIPQFVEYNLEVLNISMHNCFVCFMPTYYGLPLCIFGAYISQINILLGQHSGGVGLLLSLLTIFKLLLFFFF